MVDGMECVLEPDLLAFAERVVPFLSTRPVEHSVLLTLVDARVSGRVTDEVPPVCGYVTEHGTVVGVALRTPPFKASLSFMPAEAVVVLEEALWTVDPDAPAVTGPDALSRLFAERRSARTGRRVRPGMAQRMYALGELVPPAGVPGQAREVGPDDVRLTARWWTAFADEAVPGEPHPDAVEAVARRRRVGDLLLWWDAGRPVSLAGYVGPTVGVSRIAPVYTPPEHRRHGYGAAVTAAASAHAREHGAAEVMLYTDLANPTSNGIYQQIGYRPVADVTDFTWS